MKKNNESIFQQRYIFMWFCENKSTTFIKNKRLEMSDISYRFIYVDSPMFSSETRGFALSLQGIIIKDLHYE